MHASRMYGRRFIPSTLPFDLDLRRWRRNNDGTGKEAERQSVWEIEIWERKLKAPGNGVINLRHDKTLFGYAFFALPQLLLSGMSCRTEDNPSKAPANKAKCQEMWEIAKQIWTFLFNLRIKTFNGIIAVFLPETFGDNCQYGTSVINFHKSQKIQPANPLQVPAVIAYEFLLK